ncbi:MBL fold metallo-hydrolase [Streptomyces sp. NBC_00047]|uniref:MBL fold metallo-hydrolase n=1 Tax=Streptomyces sp. NBC_00047 TaxID=2975627 RepID=UPI0022572C6F|nr:MBL fold metallo-hydrolase [Streptomyces sp. NBC_00047]MCX5612891.1 MBL fold metallo-hydrolase [Streptomyces sp. NBC_00047]
MTSAASAASAASVFNGRRPAKGYLNPSVVPQPLLHRWYAWCHLVPPHTAALNLRERYLPQLRSYLRSPQVHASALSNPARYGGPFLAPYGGAPEDVEELLAATEEAAAPLLRLAEDIKEAQRMLAEQADGKPMESLYAQVPQSLRGLVELVYDTGNRPRLRFFEPLVHRAFAAELAKGQEISLAPRTDLEQPFTFGSPILRTRERMDLRIPFADPRLDQLYASRRTAADVAGLAELLLGDEASDASTAAFADLFTETAPAPYEAAPPDAVRMRYLNHATVLLETDSTAVLLDPLPGYADDGHRHLTLADLPERLDAVVLSHLHCDHVSVEALLQLRHRVDTVVVPRGGGGSLEDPSPKLLLQALGFTSVVELGEMESARIGEDAEVTMLPFLGEHGDLDIRSKAVPLVEIGGRRVLFATDAVDIDPDLYRRVQESTGDVDTVFIGLECVGAPMSWLYGPLMEGAQDRAHDQARRLKGCDADMAERLVKRFGAAEVFVYALGLEPWLRHLTGSSYDPQSEQIRQTNLLLDRCRTRGVPAELLYQRGERLWPRTRTRT